MPTARVVVMLDAISIHPPVEKIDREAFKGIRRQVLAGGWDPPERDSDIQIEVLPDGRIYTYEYPERVMLRATPPASAP